MSQPVSLLLVFFVACVTLGPVAWFWVSTRETAGSKLKAYRIVGIILLAGTAIAPGDKVVMWYASANYDPDAFERPREFDIARPDNAHVAFGGGGPHFCLGAFLARMEIRVLLEEMLARGMRLEHAGEPVRVASNFVHGVQSAPMRVVRA